MSNRSDPSAPASAPGPFALTFALDALSRSKPREIAATANGPARRRIAEALELAGLDAFRLSGRLSPEGRRGWRFDGRLEAQAVQTCVVTLEPAPATIDEPILRRWSPDAATDDALDVRATEPDEEDDALEPLSDPIDLGAVAIETLALALDPYPRAPDAALERTEAAPPGAAPIEETAVKPFAALAALKRASDDETLDGRPSDDEASDAGGPDQAGDAARGSKEDP